MEFRFPTCEQLLNVSKYDVFIDCFMRNLAYDDAVEIYNASRPTLCRWITEVTKSVSIQLFGVDGVDLV